MTHRTLEALGAALLVASSLPGCSGSGGSGARSGARPAPDAATPAEPAPLGASGLVSIAAATAVDGDLNDPAAPLVANDTLASAQPLPNPVLLGGYVNQPGAGPEGRSRAAGDVRDYYRAALAAGDELQLSIGADGAANDLDLALLDLDGTPVAAAAESGPIESLSAPASGDYLIEVSAFAGAARYLLSLAAGGAPAGAAPEFVPGELIVRMPETAGAAGGAADRVGALGMQWAAGDSRDELLLRCADAPQRDAAFRALGIAHLLDRDPDLASLPMRAQLVRDTPRMAKALRRRAELRSVDLNYVRRASAAPRDALFPLQWHYAQIQLPAAWDQVVAASGVRVAVLDTGVVHAHPELAGQLIGGYDFIANPTSAADGDGCDPDSEDPGDGLQPGSSSYHGTHVTGTLVARTSLQPGGDAVGVAGVAWNARVMPLRVLGRAGGTDFDLMQALRYAAGLANACNALPEKPAQLVNMSLGGPGRSEAFQALVLELRARGIALVAAAGNSGSDQPQYPAAYDGVISVSAVDFQKRRAGYSSFGPSVDVAAPGGDPATDLNADGFPDGVLSLAVDDTGPRDAYVYQFSAGTSMAAPHVAGVLALMLGVNPALRPEDLDALLAARRLTEDLGNPAHFGAGLIDARAALQAARDSRGAPVAIDEARLAVDPVLLHFGPLAREAIAVASNAGAPERPLALAQVRAETDDGLPWLSVAPQGAGQAGLGRYRVAVDRSALAPGRYSGRIRFDSDRNDVEVPVSLEVAALASAPPDAGRQHILLVDPVSRQTRHAIALAPLRGGYAFRFEKVPPGDYQVLAGTDLDHDGSICEAGEACGAYPNLAQRETLRLDATRAGIDFETAFRTSAELGALGVPPQPSAVGGAPQAQLQR